MTYSYVRNSDNLFEVMNDGRILIGPVEKKYGDFAIRELNEIDGPLAITLHAAPLKPAEALMAGRQGGRILRPDY